MTANSREKREARELAAKEGIPYAEALRRVRERRAQEGKR